MRFVGVALLFSGLMAVISMGKSPASFVNLPGLLFVLFMGIGVVLAGHGKHGLLSVPQALAGNPDDAPEAKSVLETAIDAFVAAGWIGVLIGVIQLLGALDDPSHLGAGMSICLLTALYGYIAAYLICLPLSRSITRMTPASLEGETNAG